VLSLGQLPRFFWNSALISAGVIGIVLICALTSAFGFAKLTIRGKEIYFWMLLAALTLPEVVLLAPLFATVTAADAYNTLWAVIIPSAALHIPFAALLARNFVDGIPNELIEAARVDGASTSRIFRSVVLPLTRPIVAAIFVLVFIASWNSYLLPLLFLQTPEQTNHHARTAVLHRQVQQRSDESPGRRRAHRTSSDHRLHQLPAVLRTRPRGRRIEVAPDERGSPCPTPASTCTEHCSR
jgi:ABC-type glycerol-3-phosphate transport system permease component